MPTGYTADLYDGKPVTFRQFALKCARQFGALIEFRDDDLNAELPAEIRPDPYHREALAEARAKLAEFNGRDIGEWSRLCAAWNDHADRENAAMNAGRSEGRERFVAMLQQVDAWKPPSPDHVGLRDFMKQQLADTMRWDFSPPTFRYERYSVQDFKANELRRVEEDVAYHEQHWRMDCERAKERNEWLQALRASLPEAK